PSQCLPQSGLANAGRAFDQQMSLGKNRNQSQPQYVIFSANDAAKAVLQLGRAARGRYKGFGSHFSDSTMWLRGQLVTNVIEAFNTQPSAFSQNALKLFRVT